MIRDPSDGSIRDVAKTATTAIAGASPVIDAATSGLPINKQRADYLERLERSRDWLAKYRTNPEKVAREQGETGIEKEQGE